MDNILIRRLNIARIIEKEAIFYALDNIIRNKKEVKNVNKEICNVIRFNDIYILIPISMIQMRPTITEIIEGVLIEYAGNINASNLLEKIKDDTIQKD